MVTNSNVVKKNIKYEGKTKKRTGIKKYSLILSTLKLSINQVCTIFNGSQSNIVISYVCVGVVGGGGWVEVVRRCVLCYYT